MSNPDPASSPMGRPVVTSRSFEPFQNHWLAAYPSDKLRRKPVAVTLLGQPLVLYRPHPKAVAVALQDRCPHRNAPLSAGFVRDECLVCPYHGWAFDAKGQCQRVPGLCGPIPSRAQVAGYLVMERDGIIWITFAESTPPPPYRPAHLVDSDSRHDCFVIQVEMKGTLLNAIENFLDATHTHFVHPGLVRTDKNRVRSRVDITAADDRVEATYLDEKKQSGMISRLFEKKRKDSHGRFILPGVAEIDICSDRGVEFAITAYLTPEQEHRQRAQVIVAVHRGLGLIPKRLKQAILTPFLNAAIAQDRRIVELQQENLERFGEERFLSTELDLLRPHIRLLLESGPGIRPTHRQISLEL